MGVNCHPLQGQRIRSYTADGELNSESLASGLEDCNGQLEVFSGREKTDCKFSVGDKVAVFRGNHFSFETVYALPVDRSFVNARLQDKSIGMLPDHWDDSYITIPEGGDYYVHHEHPAVVNVFPIEGLI